jgi:ribosomal protein S12 methylthiotransferase
MPEKHEHKRPDTAGGHRGQPLPTLQPGQPRPRPAVPPPAPDATPPIVGFVSLGCAKNLVDSEKMLGAIAQSGAIITGDESAADTIVVNTCGFLGAARDEALEVIADLADRKRRGALRRLVVAGCLVQRDGQGLLDDIPEIDALVGVHNRDDVATAVWERGERHRPAVDLYLGDYHGQPWSDQGRLRLTPRHYAYVRISEGCNQKCTFCTIPSIRGPMHCKPPDQLVTECRELIADGARELILIGQDTTSYGQDIGESAGLAGLLRTLDRACDGAEWLRLMYVYPSVLTDEMIEAIAACRRVVNYIDIPLQHVHDQMLRAMGRRVTRRAQETLLAKLRREIPDVSIRTTFIVGFPGETDAHFEELISFVRDFQFDAVGAFTYSFEPETPAARLPNQLDDALKQERYERLMLTQQEVAFAAARRRVGQTFDVLVDETASDHVRARHAGQAPEVDAVCLLRNTRPDPGTRLPTRCIDATGYDLLVEPARPQA